MSVQPYKNDIIIQNPHLSLGGTLYIEFAAKILPSDEYPNQITVMISDQPIQYIFDKFVKSANDIIIYACYEAPNSQFPTLRIFENH